MAGAVPVGTIYGIVHIMPIAPIPLFGLAQKPAVDLARFTQRALDRSDYRRLCETGLTTREALIAAEDATLLPLLGNDRQKLRAVRDALAKWRPDRAAAPALPVYQQ